MAGPLGCNPEYRVVIADRCRNGGDGTVRVELDRITGIAWGRTLNNISSATITLEPGCCDQVREARQGRELIIFRDDRVVWRGELLDDPADCREAVTISALDRWAILARRVIHQRLCFRAKCGGSPQGPLQIAQALIEDGYSGDDRCHDVTYVGSCAVPIERDYAANSAYTLDALSDLARSRIDYTAHGERLIVMCKDVALGQTATLTCEHFSANVCAGSGGLSSATRVIVVGDGVFGFSGGSDPYYGLLEARVEDDSIKTVEAATEEARARRRAMMPPVWWVDAPSGSHLTADAPVGIEELVPGVQVPVQLDCTCTPLSEVMRLTDIAVTHTAGDGERVAATLVSLNRIGNDGVTDDPADETITEEGA